MAKQAEPKPARAIRKKAADHPVSVALQLGMFLSHSISCQLLNVYYVRCLADVVFGQDAQAWEIRVA